MKKKVILRRGCEERILKGHMWVFSGEIKAIDGRVKPGDIVEVRSHDGRFLGKGYYNPKPKIAVRLLSFDRKEEVNLGFWRGRIKRAWEIRKALGADRLCRVVFSEGDFLPGLVADRYGNYLVVQFLTLGTDVRRWEIVEALSSEVEGIAGIYEKSDVSSRKLEGLEEAKGVLWGFVPERETIDEDGAKFVVDFAGGQKTGLFLDQRENKFLLKEIVGGKRVLDAFAYSGRFAIFSALWGAKEVWAVELERRAFDLLQENVKLNKVEVQTFNRNAFDFLRELDASGEKFDIVILDPPSFTKSKSSVESARRGYKEINLRAFKILRPGGFLLTFSCSYHFSEEAFAGAVEDAAMDARRKVQVIARIPQPKDHPTVLGMPETRYFKGLLLRVL